MNEGGGIVGYDRVYFGFEHSAPLGGSVDRPGVDPNFGLMRGGDSGGCDECMAGDGDLGLGEFGDCGEIGSFIEERA